MLFFNNCRTHETTYCCFAISQGLQEIRCAPTKIFLSTSPLVCCQGHEIFSWVIKLFLIAFWGQNTPFEISLININQPGFQDFFFNGFPVQTSRTKSRGRGWGWGHRPINLVGRINRFRLLFVSKFKSVVHLWGVSFNFFLGHAYSQKLFCGFSRRVHRGRGG